MASPIMPASPPPPGVTPNFDHPDSIVDSFMATNAACLAIAVLFLALRLYTRIFIVNSLGWDDCLYPFVPL